MADTTDPLQTDAPPFEFDFPRLVEAARRSRLGIGLSLAGVVHLVVFGACEFLFRWGDRSAAHFLPLWMLDVALASLILWPRLALQGAGGPSRATRLLVRVWLTFAILCLTSASLNTVTGFQTDWFKVSWALLGTFGFATLAWIFHLAFLIPAVQMSLTALLIATHPDHAYLIFGGSWFVTFQALAALLELQPLARRWSRRDCITYRRSSAEA